MSVFLCFTYWLSTPGTPLCVYMPCLHWIVHIKLYFYKWHWLNNIFLKGAEWKPLAFLLAHLLLDQFSLTVLACTNFRLHKHAPESAKQRIFFQTSKYTKVDSILPRFYMLFTYCSYLTFFAFESWAQSKKFTKERDPVFSEYSFRSLLKIYCVFRKDRLREEL